MIPTVVQQLALVHEVFPNPSFLYFDVNVRIHEYKFRSPVLAQGHEVHAPTGNALPTAPIRKNILAFAGASNLFQ